MKTFYADSHYMSFDWFYGDGWYFYTEHLRPQGPYETEALAQKASKDWKLES